MPTDGTGHDRIRRAVMARLVLVIALIGAAAAEAEYQSEVDRYLVPLYPLRQAADSDTATVVRAHFESLYEPPSATGPNGQATCMVVCVDDYRNAPLPDGRPVKVAPHRCATPRTVELWKQLHALYGVEMKAGAATRTDAVEEELKAFASVRSARKQLHSSLVLARATIPRLSQLQQQPARNTSSGAPQQLQPLAQAPAWLIERLSLPKVDANAAATESTTSSSTGGVTKWKLTADDAAAAAEEAAPAEDTSRLLLRVFAPQEVDQCLLDPMYKPQPNAAKFVWPSVLPTPNPDVSPSAQPHPLLLAVSEWLNRACGFHRNALALFDDAVKRLRGKHAPRKFERTLTTPGKHLDTLESAMGVRHDAARRRSARGKPAPALKRLQKALAANKRGGSQPLTALDDVTGAGSRAAARCAVLAPEEVRTLTPGEFLREYVAKSRPVVLRGAAADWPALQKWSTAWLVAQFGDRDVHVKLAERGQFEGCEHTDLWAADGADTSLPPHVRAQLPFPDRVVVRPAPLDMTFGRFVELLHDPLYVNASFYVEYSSVSAYFPELLDDLHRFPFAAPLREETVNAWIGNGRTVGKLHFDATENLLVMVSGSKELALFPPFANEHLYEAHIRQAELRFNMSSAQFKRNKLLDSTSMVMSPVDLSAPLNTTLRDFPLFAHALDEAVHCTIHEGDALFLPSYWWHDVHSRPDSATHSRNVAINFWFTPLYTKQFPCQRCRMHFNAKSYAHLLPLLTGADDGVASAGDVNSPFRTGGSGGSGEAPTVTATTTIAPARVPHEDL